MNLFFCGFPASNHQKEGGKKARIFFTFFLVPSEDFILPAQHIIMFGPFLSQFQYNHAWHVARNEQIK
jgi:hypothetical protein